MHYKHYMYHLEYYVTIWEKHSRLKCSTSLEYLDVLDAWWVDKNTSNCKWNSIPYNYIAQIFFQFTLSVWLLLMQMEKE